MNHQIAEFKHDCGIISVFDKGILVSTDQGDFFLGEDFVANYDLYCTFLGLVNEGIVTHVGGMVTASEGQPPTDVCTFYWLAEDKFLIIGTQDDGAAVPVSLDFLELLRSSCGFLMVDGSLKEGTNWQSWSIGGHFPDTDLAFAIDGTVFEIYVKEGGNTYICETTTKERSLWYRGLAIGRRMLERDLPDGSWQIIGPRSELGMSMRLEVEGDRILLSVHNPELPEVNTSIYLDDAAMASIRLLLDSVWDTDRGDSVDPCEDCPVLDEYDDDEEEGAAS